MRGGAGRRSEEGAGTCLGFRFWLAYGRLGRYLGRVRFAGMDWNGMDLKEGIGFGGIWIWKDLDFKSLLERVRFEGFGMGFEFQSLINLVRAFLILSSLLNLLLTKSYSFLSTIAAAVYHHRKQMAHGIEKGSTALQVWTDLETLFRDNKDPRTMQLDSELRNLVMGDLSVHAYFAKIKGIADLLANLDPASAVPDKHLVNYAINGLSSRFESVANIIRYRSPLPSFLEVRSMLLMEEQRLSNHRPAPIASHVDHSSSSMVLNVNTNRGPGQGRRTDRRQQSHRQGQGRRPPPSTTPPRYGWVYIPPPTSGRTNQPRNRQNAPQPWSVPSPTCLAHHRMPFLQASGCSRTLPGHHRRVTFLQP
ncbi:hypothetical protein OSB04_001516 [Centaurea solstitialis]|uniref:Hybrid signal transduction histidine kinase M n=1 Tax=Centaurea solstitialis TaxID=347529 RepID=A0AA38WSQ5_9ASTR|nr:hypothetical protein OSB04_001516 [Centaurea solstitialis]